MRSSAVNPFRKSSRAFRVTAVSAVVVFTAVASGIPVSTSVPEKQSSGEAYPCTDCPCGCSSAEQCWRNCCCHTLSERLAWAKRNGVRPPEFVLRDLQPPAVEVCDARECDSETSGESCCSERPAKAVRCNASRNDCKTPNANCGCELADAIPATKRRDAPNNESTRTAKSLILLNVLRCQGASTHWLGAPLATPPPPLITYEYEVTFEYLAATAPPRVANAAKPPPTPPPRAANCVS